MTRWFWTSAILAVALVVVAFGQSLTIEHYRRQSQASQFLLQEMEQQLSESSGIIAEETGQMIEAVDLQTWERMLPGYLDFYSNLDADLLQIESALAELITPSLEIDWAEFVSIYQDQKEGILDGFSRFEQHSAHRLGRTEEEIIDSPWSDRIIGFFLADASIEQMDREVLNNYFQDYQLSLLDNHLATLSYEIKLQTTALGCQRGYFPAVVPQVHFPHSNIQQGDSLEAWVNVVRQLDYLNPEYSYLIVNGDTLTLETDGFARFVIPSSEIGKQELEVAFYGLDPIAKKMEESILLYPYEVLRAE